MKEFRDIVSFYETALAKKQRSALVTVVKVVGSAYRGPGARMLLTDDGKWTGAVSGGCLEMTALKKSLHAIHKNEVQLISFHTLDEDNLRVDYATGCNGNVDLLIEPINEADANNPIQVLKNCLGFKNTGVVATVIRSGNHQLAMPGQHVVLNPEQIFENNTISEHLLAQVEKDMYEVLETKASHVYSYEEGIDVFIEIIQPPVNLLIFGSGSDVRPMVHLASFLGWQVTVIDNCVKPNRRSTFPGAAAVINCQARDIRRRVQIAPLTAAVLMSHNYEYDLEVLPQLLKTTLSYVGIMGSQKKTERMFHELDIPGPNHPGFDCRIHTPVGLDIGAETAEEIAFSIITEIMSVFTGTTGKSLKNTTGFIHRRNTHAEEVCKLVYSEFVKQ